MVFHSLGKRGQTDYLIRAFRVFRGMGEIWGHRGVTLQIRWKETLRENGNTIVRVHVTAGLRSKSFPIRVVND